jgi:signal transduction histidine kinase
LIEDALWRVTQEALSNIARHSQASSMYLDLEWTEQQIKLYLSDNGQGFEMAEHESKGFGLRSIRERIEQVGGTISIQSARGVGTRIVAYCPCSMQPTNALSENEVTT